MIDNATTENEEEIVDTGLQVIHINEKNGGTSNIKREKCLKSLDPTTADSFLSMMDNSLRKRTSHLKGL